MKRLSPIPKSVRLVACSHCRHFQRDVSGPSANVYTHVYFMGICCLGLNPDATSRGHLFANHLRQCPHFDQH